MDSGRIELYDLQEILKQKPIEPKEQVGSLGSIGSETYGNSNNELAARLQISTRLRDSNKINVSSI
jgi:hypothetical protein